MDIFGGFQTLCLGPPPLYDEIFRSAKIKPQNEQKLSKKHWTKRLKDFIKSKPVLILFLIILFNGLFSMAIAAIFIQLEAPHQKIRLQNKIDLLQKVTYLRSNLSLAVKQKSPKAKHLFNDYVNTLEEYLAIPEEIEWEMLSAAAFVNSVSSTTGHGHILPVTTSGKVLTLLYALYGIPVFMWYIIRLGALCRVVVKRFTRKMYQYLKYLWKKHFGKKRITIREYGIEQLLLNITKPVLQVVGNVQIPEDTIDFTEELREDNRCHPVLPGTVLLVFLLSVASFISHMEDIPYFDAFYACFITYSTIGFGDIDIYVNTVENTVEF